MIGTQRRPEERRIQHVRLDRLTAHPLNVKLYGSEKPDQKLIDSIRVLGVIEPLIVTQRGQIISGHRRWLAAKVICAEDKISEKKIHLMTMTPDHMPNDAWYGDEGRAKDEDDNPLLLEKYLIESNWQRVKTPTQKSREFTELKRIEKALAKIRMEAGKKADPTKTFTEGKTGEAAVKAAKVIGMSRPTAEKLEKVVAAADRGDESAKAAITAVDAGKKSISAAYKAVIAPTPPKDPELGAKIQAQLQASTKAAQNLTAPFTHKKIDGAVSRGGAKDRFHLILRNLTAEQIRAVAAALCEPTPDPPQPTSCAVEPPNLFVGI